MADIECNQDSWRSPRVILAFAVLLISICGVFFLAYEVLSATASNPIEKKLEVAQAIFTSILPVLATWVGTVLAYYFSKENFESANRNVREMVSKITSIEKLQSISASKVMIPLKDMACFRYSAQQPDETRISLRKDLLALAESAKRNRIPILDQNDRPKYVIHRSLIDRFLSSRSLTLQVPAAGGSIAGMLEQITLKDLSDSSSDEVRKFISVSFGTVKETDTLADAKRQMDREEGRLDVLVTKDGTADSPVIGWITNLIINDNATV